MTILGIRRRVELFSPTTRTPAQSEMRGFFQSATAALLATLGGKESLSTVKPQLQIAARVI